MKKKIALPLASMLVLTALLTACSNNKSSDVEPTKSQPAASDNGDTSKRIKVSAMTILYSAAPPDKSSGMKILEDKYNMDYTFIPVAAADYYNKLGVAVASGDLPDLTVYPGLDENWYNYLDNGVFMPLEDYINEKDTPNIAKIPKETLGLVTYKGHVYGLPRLRSQAAHTLTIRKDWLDKLGLAMPTTYDELEAVMKQFVERDPDGNGKKDTYGLAFNAGSGTLGAVSLLGSFNTPTNINWSKHTDGKIYPVLAHPNFRDGLSYLTKLYKEGILSKDFVIMKGNQAEDDFLNGRAGVIGDFAWNAYSMDRLNKARAVNPNFQWEPIPALKGPNGFQGYAKGSGINGFVAIPATQSKDAAKVKRMLKFLDDQMAADMNSDPYKILNYGKEGEHYNLKDGKVVYTDLGNKERPSLYLITNPPSEATGLNNPNDSKEIQDVKNASYKAALAGTPYSDPALKLVPTPTLKEKGTELNKNLFENIVKVITGEQSLESYDKALADWKTKGGQKILDEMNEAYMASQGQTK
ncbi:extracellular solute-binding protein [Paenibacillus oryzisoli]|uniref:extracellular solute-binding protein n=1 Tax=Paenibacillus oryzisoli TaxID=1850517 RepID=UPI003D2E6539